MGFGILEPKGNEKVPGTSLLCHPHLAIFFCRATCLLLILLPPGTTRYYDDPDRPRLAGEHDAHLKTTPGGLILVPTFALPPAMPSNSPPLTAFYRRLSRQMIPMIL